MSIFSRSFRMPLAMLLALSCVAPPAFAGTELASTATIETDTTNWSAGTEGRGSQLNAGGSIIIQAPVASAVPATIALTTPVTPVSSNQADIPVASLPAATLSSAACYAVTNNSKTNVTYFVPWNTPAEWSAFLAATSTGSLSNIVSVGQCCSMQANMPLVDANGKPCVYPTGSYFNTPAKPAVPANTPITVTAAGSRVGGLASMPKSYYQQDPTGYALSGDNSAFVTSSQIYGAAGINVPTSSSINFTGASFYCKNGQWVQNNGEGSCVAMGGNCVSNYANVTSLPGDLNTLCAPGSLFGGFTTGSVSSGPPWTWNCLGTPGEPSASCSATGVGQCAANLSSLTAPLPTDLSAFCATGTFGAFTQGNLASTGPWSWTCQGATGTTPTACTTSTGTDGVCGTQNNQAFDGPSNLIGSLCQTGTPSKVSGPDKDGTNGAPLNTPPDANGTNLYHWTCAGTNGGATTSCSGPALSGQCGSIGQTISTAANFRATGPSMSADVMCVTGTPKPMPVYYGPMTIFGLTALGGRSAGFVDWDSLYYGYSGYTGWQWACVTPSGQGDTCTLFDSSAQQPGGCGELVQETYTSTTVVPAQKLGLCNFNSTLKSGPTLVPGTPAQWTWTCAGVNGGTPATCNVIVDPNPPVCGPASQDQGQPTHTLCTSGTASTPQNNNTNWVWTCTSAVGTKAWCGDAGESVNGVCGSAKGNSSATAPATGLCTTGKATTVLNNNGTWTWYCNATGAGTTQLCTAPVTNSGSTNLCGAANGGSSATAPSASPSTNLCVTGSTLSGSPANDNYGQWVWACTSGSNVTNCSATNTSAPSNSSTGPGVCGGAAGTADWQAPNVNLCSAGSPNAGGAALNKSTNQWGWTCIGATTQSCTANNCSQCSGSSTTNFTGSITTATISGCSVQVYPTWTETDTLGNAAVTQTLKGTSPYSFSFTLSPSSVSGYCQPCYQSTQSVGNIHFTATAKKGTCSGDASLNTGNPVSYSASGVTLTGQ